ncbi:MAG TPA: T9SS type A sorting domain-containing protein, partial [Ignavibacteria bacterium]|nr:T9SS type A sorting domain-containing protein [Ignavibacteria bacterium]
FSLEQNYPNPFNPSTKINYSVPTAGNVSIKIYNSVGVEIMTVVDKNVAAGNYSKTIDMSKFPTGIYFYTMRSGSFTETRKMMLVK